MVVLETSASASLSDSALLGSVFALQPPWLSPKVTRLLGSYSGAQSPAHSGNTDNTCKEGEARCWRRKQLTQSVLGSLSFKLKFWETYSPYEPTLNSFTPVMTVIATGMSPSMTA